MAVQKGKQGTKGQKQIVEENKQTIKFYALMAAGATGFYVTMMATVFSNSFTIFYWIMAVFAVLVYGGCIQAMRYMARSCYSESGQLLDGGIDLNMEAGIAEHLKDLVILTAAVQAISLLSNYFWLLWLLAPGRAFYLLWVNILGPWFFQPAAPEVDDKKQRKLERKMRRH
ncbi:transmembrane protein 208-like [Ornithodoros turicata]|uniref:Transmembrane protein 208 n=1 Tax=Ornithodoros turicata TaxID=34597 RepID=A0A2R5LH85_9ACAR